MPTREARVDKLEEEACRLIAPPPLEPSADALRTWSTAVDFSLWAAAHGGRDKVIETGEIPPGLQMSAFTWALDVHLAPLLPADLQVGDNWRVVFRDTLAAVIDWAIDQGDARLLPGAGGLANVISIVADTMRQSGPANGRSDP